eukprot:scaffold665763_cov52-Prasinocladus_malaysianus.AAC.1
MGRPRLQGFVIPPEGDDARQRGGGTVHAVEGPLRERHLRLREPDHRGDPRGVDRGAAPVHLLGPQGARAQVELPH